MHFHYSSIFFLLIPFTLLILVYVWSSWKRKRDLQKLGDWHLIRDLIPIEALRRRKKKDLIALLALAVLIFAAAGPQFGSRLKEVKHRGVDVFIAMDTSRSMLAEDIPPSRLSRAKRALSLIIQKLEGNRIGIIAYAKYAIIQCPLTIDIDAARMFLEILDTKSVPVQGTSIGDAIRTAIRGFGDAEDKGGKAIVLLTDGEDHDSDPLEAAKEAKEKGITIFTIGIGTTKGEVIKKKDERGKVTEFHKHKGEMVLSRLDDALLAKIATITGGQYYRASSSDKEIDEIAAELTGFEKKEFATKIYQRLKEQYQIFAFFALILLLLEFFFAEKKGQITRIQEKLQSWGNTLTDTKHISLLLLSLFLFPVVAQAEVKAHVRKGTKLMKKGNFEGARGEFESAQIDAPEAAFLPYNIALTYYLEGDFEEAQVYYEQADKMARNPSLKTIIAYNLGHLQFFKGDKEGAIEQFKRCLKFNPKDVDAKYNIEYIKAGKEPKMPPQQKQKNKDGKSDKEQKGKKDKSDKNKSDDQQDQDKDKKDEDISKEEAEQILQLIEDQEKENLKNQKPIHLNKPEEKDKKNQNYEDW